MVCLWLFAFISAARVARAESTIAEGGEGAGHVSNPEGLAVDSKSGRLYVADEGNLRVDVFDSEGSFLFAFGWGVKDGASELQRCTATCRKGLSGTGKGQFFFEKLSFGGPTSIAIDNDPASPSFNDVYAVDYGNFRVEKFDPEGNFILTFGGGVNKTTSGDVCTATSGDVCGSGAQGGDEGAGEGEFSGSAGIFVDVGPGGTVYVVDSQGKEGHFNARLQRFEPSGAVIAPEHIFSGGAVGGEGIPTSFAGEPSGAFYLAEGPNLNKYNASASSHELIESGAGFHGLAADGSGDLYAAQGEPGAGAVPTILKFGSSGALKARFGYGTLTSHNTSGLALHHSAGGDIYASIGAANTVKQLDFPSEPPGPIVFPEGCSATAIGNAHATLNAKVNPEGKETTYHFQYVDQKSFATEGGFASPSTQTTADGTIAIVPFSKEEAEEKEVANPNFKLHPATEVAEVAGETKYHCRVVASNADKAGVAGPEGTFKSKPALEITASFSTAVSTESAILHAEVNPLGTPTNGYFQYVANAAFQAEVKAAEEDPAAVEAAEAACEEAEEAAIEEEEEFDKAACIEERLEEHGFDHAARVPEAPGELDFGASEEPAEDSAEASGLEAGTLYRYRVVADDHKAPPVGGPPQSFETFEPPAEGLPDNRRYEMVSPPQKQSAEVAVPGGRGGLAQNNEFLKTEAASDSGEAFTYTSWTSFGEPEAGPSTSQYLARRGAGGWEDENVSPFGSGGNPLHPPYRGFSRDLTFAGVVVSEPPLDPECQEGTENLYLRENESGSLTCLTINPPAVAEGEEFCLSYAGASADGSRAFFAASGALTPDAPEGKGFSLYEWSAAEGLSLVSVLPGELAAAPAATSGFGAKGDTKCHTGQSPIANAVSAEGSVAIWTYGGSFEGAAQPLLARIEGSRTIELDAKVSGSGSSGGGLFKAAAPDGSAVFFTDENPLISGAHPKDLYRYDLEAETLEDLTQTGSEAASAEGLLGIGADGRSAYFTATGAITGEEENARGERAIAGRFNLYRWKEGEGVRFIASLATPDENDWSRGPANHTSRVSADGRHLAFVSTAPLTGYDNTIATGDHCQPNGEPNGNLIGSPSCPEAYLYDAQSGVLRCASCDPSGARPEGPAILPAYSNPFEGPRYLSEAGDRLLFESLDSLSPADQNGRRDVYEAELPGAGSCSEGRPAFHSSSGLCVFLITSGRSGDESFLFDASSDGRDVFFATREALVGWDVDRNYDVYDARVGGGFPEPPPVPPPCEAEGCKAPPSAPPPAPPSATATFSGPGNAKPKPRKKKHHKKHKPHHRRGHRRGARR